MTSRRSLLAVLGGVGALIPLHGWAEASAAGFKPGQVWKLADPAYPTVTVVIDKLEEVGGLSVVHVSLLGVPANTKEGARYLTAVAHMPFTVEAVRRSVGAKVSDNGPVYEGFEDGYAQWRSARGGIFTITIPEAIRVVSATMSSAAQQQ